VFTITGDNCGEYLVPVNQTNALIYEQEVVYTYTSTGTNVTWQYTSNLQLPVYCMKCAKSLEVNATLAGAPNNQTLGFNATQYNTLIDPTDRLVYGGPDFF
jgi:hypothetical protein